MIYNGAPDGSGNCTNTTGTDTQISTGKFNTNNSSAADVGYMYGTRYTYSSKYSSELVRAYVYGKDVTYLGGTYTLTNTITSTGSWSTDYDTLNNNHYTCFTTGNTCSSVYYVYYTSYSYAYYITLTNGKKVGDAIDEMFNGSNVNANSSTAKTTIDNWYNSNLSSYTSYIEDTVYCNDRSISQLNGWNPNGGDTSKYLYFSPRDRALSTYTPTLSCSRDVDRFTVSSSKGNGKLTYPVGLITADEVMYAGGKGSTGNNTYYLYTNQTYLALSPYYFNFYLAGEISVNSSGYFNYNSVSGTYGLRPVVSLDSSNSLSAVVSGDGTSTNPYVIQTN